MQNTKHLALTIILCLALWLPATSSHADPPQTPQPILTIPQVKVGMKGYGLTVFHGTEIKPFNVEVVSINANETPGRSVIWVRCTDENMIRTGPVQGMSGSPIYLWDDESQDHVIGQGGKLIGAFAFGYPGTNECVVGVQPIEHMREVAQRATAQGRPKLSYLAAPGAGLAYITQLSDAAKQIGLSDLQQTRLDFTRQLFDHITPKYARQPQANHPDHPSTRMLMPMAVSSPQIAQLLGPTLKPMGIQTFAVDPQALGGTPPQGFNVDNVTLQPGAALVVPFAYGDADLMGIGTVTDVLPDGTVLGFGHAMDGIGVTAIPMATGYVHFIVSSTDISYKRGGTLQLVGSIVQDEQSAVAGTDQIAFKAAPVNIALHIEGQPTRHYEYEVVNVPGMTAQIAAAVVAQSATAVQEAPIENTVTVKGGLTFSGGHTFEIDTTIVGQGATAAAAIVAQVAGAIIQNPFEETLLESINLDIQLDYGIDAWEIISAKTDRTTAAPGDTVNVTLELSGLRQQPFTHNIQVTIPEDANDGDMQILIGDAQTIMPLALASQPGMMAIDDVAGIVNALNIINGFEPKAIYTSIPTTRSGIAIQGQEMPQLPSSRAAILTTGQTAAQPYPINKIIQQPMDRVITGQTQLRIAVKKPTGAR